jgi:hypothetical protein
VEGGAAHGYPLLVCVLGAPSPCIYRWEGEGSNHGAPQVGGILLGGLVQFVSPLSMFFRRGEEGGERREGRGRPNCLPFLLSSPFPFPFLFGQQGGRSSPCWLLRFSSWPNRPISLPGGARNPFR